MRTFDTKKEYYDWVHSVAENNLEYDGSGPKFVAHRVVHALEKIGENEYAQLFNGEPYCGLRTPPSEVHNWSSVDLDGDYEDSSYRDLAVERLAIDIQDAQDAIQN